ncbi:SUMO-activating enzyme subunit 2-A [Symbiodinium microadriaticum]|uniref:SUMO-activating enzyme subunit 2-A n=1 Tax=Symbiodinium microadriaticum TaxID=2951 RepID=A0A1Q9EAG3_SYMMI|nr:SUMO-activating enzyme subunit 2-A [Symbiodinium microadriaticum]
MEGGICPQWDTAMTAKRSEVGTITFEGETDVTGLDFETIVRLEVGEVLVYPQPRTKPEIGVGLNKVTMYQCWPPNGSLLAQDTEQQEEYKRRIKLMTEEKKARPFSYKCVIEQANSSCLMTALDAVDASSAGNAAVKTVLGEERFKMVQQAKLLVVGAGGIGCELLKNLVLTGFIDIEVVDLDTIDVRAYEYMEVFGKEVVAAEAVKQFRPDAKIVSHHGNVKVTEDPRFTFFFRQRGYRGIIKSFLISEEIVR